MSAMGKPTTRQNLDDPNGVRARAGQCKRENRALVRQRLYVPSMRNASAALRMRSLVRALEFHKDALSRQLEEL